jgi:hypothetical protein
MYKVMLDGDSQYGDLILKIVEALLVKSEVSLNILLTLSLFLLIQDAQLDIYAKLTPLLILRKYLMRMNKMNLSLPITTALL